MRQITSCLDEECGPTDRLLETMRPNNNRPVEPNTGRRRGLITVTGWVSHNQASARCWLHSTGTPPLSNSIPLVWEHILAQTVWRPSYLTAISQTPQVHPLRTPGAHQPGPVSGSPSNVGLQSPEHPSAPQTTLPLHRLRSRSETLTPSPYGMAYDESRRHHLPISDFNKNTDFG